MSTQDGQRFSIEFTDEPSTSAARGRLVLGTFEEAFEASLSFWSRADYRAHWRRAVRRIVDGAPASALVTSMHDPESANFIRWWPMYRDGETVRFQEHLLFLDDLVEPFDLADVDASVPVRRTTSDDGDAISEWTLPADILAHFVEASS